jgi:3-hydroxybutyryl-CoA dehydrogenase
MTSETIGVVGLGLLGRGIVACLLSRGFSVVAVARTADEHAAATPVIEQMLSELTSRDSSSSGDATSWRSRLTQAVTCEPLAGVSFVIESVTEDLATKQQVFDDLERVLATDAIIASNTSAIPISVLQQTRKHPERFVGMHWAEPAHATRFLEIIRGEATSDETISKTEALARRVGKDPTVCRKDVPGFIVNRIAYAMYREALDLVDRGIADFETVDRSLRNTLGLWAASCGPFRWIDLTGGPALYARAMQRVLPTLSASPDVPAPIARLANDDARGIANGRGFYEYTADEVHTWEERQRRHVWSVKTWLDGEFPIETPPDSESALSTKTP